MAKKCGVCKTGDLIPSGCGCNNPGCANYVEHWKRCSWYSAPQPKPPRLAEEIPPQSPNAPRKPRVAGKPPKEDFD
jgi:hypothetical protein